MNRKIISVIVTSLVMTFILGTTAFAASSYFNQDINLPANQVYVAAAPIERSMKYKDVYAALLAVRPPAGGTDNYEKVQVQLRNMNGIIIGTATNWTLSEVSTTFSTLTIKDGYYDTQYVYFHFRGNNPSYAAVATVSYYTY